VPDLDAAEIPAPRAARPAEEPPAAKPNRTRIAVGAAVAALVATVAVGSAVTGGEAPSPGAVAPTRAGAPQSGSAGQGQAPGTGTTGSVSVGAAEDATGGGLLTRAARDAQRVVDASGS